MQKNMKISRVFHLQQLIRPSSPTPFHLKEHKLSFIDEMIPHSYFPLILYYSSTTKTTNQEEIKLISQGLRNSLSDTLTEFYPLAGRIKGQTSIDCNDEGIYYSEARIDICLSDLIKSQDLAVIDELVPCKSNGNVSDEKEMVRVQVTFFDCGGLAIGICQSHRIGDGCTLSTFIKSWASKSCSTFLQTNLMTMMISPVFNSANIFPPKGSPDFRPNPKPISLQPPIDQKVVNKHFIFDPSLIHILKKRVLNQFPADEIENPSRLEIISALIWKSWMVALNIQDSIAFHPVNLRGKIIPSLSKYSFGNLFQMAKGIIKGTELESTNWISLVEKLRAGIRKIDKEYGQKLVGENGSEISRTNMMQIAQALYMGDVDIIKFSSWGAFQLYKVDFGWGNPIWVSTASHSCKNMVNMFDSSCGGIEAWIAMVDNEMPKFEKALKELLQVYTI
ncbi:hypothetical protein M9H77_24266 [Catharanthus roseus]|uniref:Uncharacterized protein n=1 Tax=Catharanthus roseus TaxID=4058 RepID=A0ACC0AZQ9_CATRO|nr:hypothetical protein M9H77_24266 [Catharanthus roseus]